MKLYDATIKTMNVWELELTPRVTQKDEKAGRKRKRRNEYLATPDEAPPLQQPGPLPPAAESASLECCVYVEPSGTVVRVGSFYSLVFGGNSVFVCTGISRVACQFTYKFVLCSLVNDKVDNLIHDVYCSVMDVKYVCNSDVTCTSKVRNLLDKIICEGWKRVLRCQERNIGSMSYLLDLRESCLASQMRQGVWSGISRSATRPSQPLHLGVFDPVLDTQIFGLSNTNNFQISYKGKDIARLDSLLGAVWDVKVLEPGNPQSHLKYVCQVRLFVHKPSMSLRFNFAYSESNAPFTPTYRDTCIY